MPVHLRNDVLDFLLLVCLLHNTIEVSDSQPVCVSRCLAYSHVPLCNVYAPLNVWHYHITRLSCSPFLLFSLSFTLFLSPFSASSSFAIFLHSRLFSSFSQGTFVTIFRVPLFRHVQRVEWILIRLNSNFLLLAVSWKLAK